MSGRAQQNAKRGPLWYLWVLLMYTNIVSTKFVRPDPGHDHRQYKCRASRGKVEVSLLEPLFGTHPYVITSYLT